MKKSFIVAGTLLTSLALASCGSADTEASDGGDGDSVSLQLTSTWGPSTPYGEAIEQFVTQVDEETDGRVDIEVFWDGSLIPGDDVLNAVGTGRADMGYLNNSYFPTELPLFQYVSIPFHSTDMRAAQAAWNDLLENNEAFQDEWANHNVVNLGIQAVSPMILSGADEPTGVDWLENKSIRATSYTAEAVSKAGASPVGLTVGELYESMQRGVIQGYTSMNLGTVPSLSLEEVSPYVADPGLGTYSTVALVVNNEIFESLSEEDQEILIHAGSELSENYLAVVDRVEDEACQTIKDAGGEVTVWDESEVSEWRDLIGDDLLDQWKDNIEQAGLDPDAFIADYEKSYEANKSSETEGALERCASN